MHLLLDAQDAQAFDHTVTQLASRLGDLGDPDPLDLRRARAVGILADPQHALDLIHGPVDQQTRHAIQDGCATKDRHAGAAQIFVHVTPNDLAEHVEAGTGSATVERWGAVSLELLEAWLAGRKISIRPVLHLNGPHTPTAVDRHEPTPAMREHVVQRDATCVFPGWRRDSRSCDLDHIEPWVPPHEGGPPGQTHPSNLAPLCRTHHRITTFSDWRYRLRPDGAHAWTSPAGHHDLVPAAPRHVSA